VSGQDTLRRTQEKIDTTYAFLMFNKSAASVLSYSACGGCFAHAPNTRYFIADVVSVMQVNSLMFRGLYIK